MSKKEYDILIVGYLAGNDMVLAEHLERRGLKCVVVRQQNLFEAQRQTITELAKYHSEYPPEDIAWITSPLQFLRIARKSKMIVAFSGSIMAYLRWLWPFRKLVGVPPIANWHTGSDIFELARARNWRGALYRDLLRSAALNIGFSYPEALKTYIQLRIPRLVFIHFPYLLANVTASAPKNRNKLRFFHPSNIDFKVTDAGGHRLSSKGNDRFIRAFARALKSGLNAECVILDRGSDRQIAKDLIAGLGVSDAFVWKEQLTRDELVEEILESDVVVDQFDVGGHGGIAIEAMWLKKPVMLWVDEKAYQVSYSEPPPILNARTEDEIYERLMQCEDREYLVRLGESGKEWVNRYNNWETCLDPFVFYYQLIVGAAT